MIRDIELINFRRHVHTRIDCNPDDQVIVVAGRNGTGKTSLFEAVNVALFGEGRNGPRNLDRLVRRGGELEGMQVAVGFSVAGEDYRVVRRRDGRAVSAQLFAGDQPLIEGVRAVNAAVVELLGCDAAGWRLATYARQKELDALAKLGDTARARAIGRLLRLDALGRAAIAARAVYRTHTDIVEALDSSDPKIAANDVDAARTQLAAMAANEEAARKTIDELRSSLADTAHIDDAHRAAVLAAERLEGELNGVRADIGRLQAERATLNVDDAPECDDDISELEAAGHRLDIEIARAEENRRVAQRRETLARDLQAAVARLTVLDNADAAEGDARTHTATLEQLEQRRQDAAAKIEELRTRRDNLLETAAAARAMAQAANDAAARADELDDECDTCGQPVSDHTRQQLVERRQNVADSAAADAAAATDAARAVTEQLGVVEAELATITNDIRAAETKFRAAVEREGERGALAPARDSYANQLERLQAVDVDVDSLLEARGDITARLGIAKAAQQRAEQRTKVLARQAEIDAELVRLTARADQLSAAAAAAGPDAQLSAAAAERAQAEMTLRSELELLGGLTAATATARSELEAAERRLAESTERAANRNRHMGLAVAGSDAHRLLTDVEQHLGAQIRPSLEGTVGDLLGQLSDGRFTQVKIGADYDCRVDDSGDWRRIEDLSGGEGDLVALAVRLGLAELVGTRSGGGMGILVLDEILGSQDAGRRDTIMSTLRSLRGRYEQIWSISHVGGVEDAADRVITVTIDDDGNAHTDG